MKLFTGILLYCFCIPAYSLDVFFVHSYHHAYPWVQEYYTAFKDRLGTASLEDYQMDTKRIPHQDFQTKANEAIQLIQQKKPKVVVVSDDNALRLVGKPALQQGYKVVFLGVNGNPRLVLPITSNLAGVLERPLLKRSVAELTRIIPDLRRILVLMDDGPTTTAIINTSFDSKMRQEIAGVQVNVRRLRHLQEWQAEIGQSKAKGYDLIIIANYAKLLDNEGIAVELDVTSRWSSQHSQIPLFGFWGYSIGKGKAVGGLVLSGADQGRSSADIVNHYLKEERFPNPSIVTPKKGRYLFSKSELLRWKLILPADIEHQVEWMQ